MRDLPFLRVSKKPDRAALEIGGNRWVSRAWKKSRCGKTEVLPEEGWSSFDELLNACLFAALAEDGEDYYDRKLLSLRAEF